MSRPRDENRRTELLAAAAAHAAEHGLAGMSLRPLAAALGTSDRMLVHYFGSKDELVARLVEAGRPDLGTLLGPQDDRPPRTVALAFWAAMVDDAAQAARVRLMLEVMVLATTRPEPYRRLATDAHRGWWEPVAAAVGRRLDLPAPAAHAVATALVSGFKGIALDRFVTGDRERTDAAARALVDALLPDTA